MPRRHLFLLLAAFALSLTVRWPLLNRPLSGHHELCTALVLTVLHNWHHDGYLAHDGAPAITFSGPADRIPPGYTNAPGLRDGVLYYLSHPPLAYDLPHALFVVSGTQPNAFGLQLFNLLFHLTTAVGLYLVVRELTTVVAAPLYAALLYLFMPAPLWFHGNVYMSDMFVQNAWVWHLLFALRALKPDSRVSWRAAWLCGATIFLTTAITWPGVWAGVALAVVALWQWRAQHDSSRLRLVAAAVVGVGAAVLFTAWRWLQVVDADALLAYFHGRYDQRGSAGLHLSWSDALTTIALNYRINWLPLVLPLALFFILRRGRAEPRLRLASFVTLTSLPILLEMLFLFDYSLHDFAVLKAGPLLCGLAALGLSAVQPRWAWSALIITCAAGVLYFYRTNPIDSATDDRFTQQMEQGLAIAQEADPDEMVFTQGFTTEPQVQWYAKRTLFRIDSLQQARQLMRSAGQSKGVVFRQSDAGLAAEHIFR